MTDEKDKPTFDRRNFFREGLREFLNPVSEFLADRINNLPDFSAMMPDDEQTYDDDYTESYEEPFHLRPPGASEEEQFLTECLRCGACMLACPHDAIVIINREELSETGTYDPYSWRPYKETGTPKIVPYEEPCRMCKEFPCANACPSGALTVPSGKAVIGCAVPDHQTCLRAEKEQCTSCIDACPLEEKAVSEDAEGKIQVSGELCTGCGFCENACPQEPPAIRVKPPEREG